MTTGRTGGFIDSIIMVAKSNVLLTWGSAPYPAREQCPPVGLGAKPRFKDITFGNRYNPN